NAENVLNADGKSVPGFTWSDPNKTFTQRQALEAKGINFSPDGYADPAQRVGAHELLALVAEEGEIEVLSATSEVNGAAHVVRLLREVTNRDETVVLARTS